MASGTAPDGQTGQAISSQRKDTLNIVFVGHVDAGKSTIGGHILYLTDQIDQRTLEKYQRESKEMGRESWYWSWALDTQPEEREKGKTVEAAHAAFEVPLLWKDEQSQRPSASSQLDDTEPQLVQSSIPNGANDQPMRHITVLDAPGHKGYVPNMISAACQADVAVLVISARRGEFETGFEKGGQTREHAMLVKTVGVRQLVVLINKMDDPTVNWSEERFQECRSKLEPFLKRLGFNLQRDVHFMPCSGYTGAFLRDSVPTDVCPFYRGPTFFEFLGALPSIPRNVTGPVRLPILARFSEMGTCVVGKLERGTIAKNATLTLMPNRSVVQVMQLWIEDNEVEVVYAGDNVRLRLKGVEESDVSKGFVLCSAPGMNPATASAAPTPSLGGELCHVTSKFDARIFLLEGKSIVSPGYYCMMHIHEAVEQVTLSAIICMVDKKTGEKIVPENASARPKFMKPDTAAIVRFQLSNVGSVLCMENYKDLPALGRFTLREESTTIAFGIVLKIID